MAGTARPVPMATPIKVAVYIEPIPTELAQNTLRMSLMNIVVPRLKPTKTNHPMNVDTMYFMSVVLLVGGLSVRVGELMFL